MGMATQFRSSRFQGPWQQRDNQQKGYQGGQTSCCAVPLVGHTNVPDNTSTAPCQPGRRIKLCCQQCPATMLSIVIPLLPAPYMLDFLDKCTVGARVNCWSAMKQGQQQCFSTAQAYVQQTG